MVDHEAGDCSLVVGNGAQGPGSSGEAPEPWSHRRYPRVDAPVVHDQPSSAIREDTPGYIPQAFPKISQFGTGDFHDPRGGRRGRWDFGMWGRFVMQWHDGRALRHTRFRFWFLNTWLRMKTPGRAKFSCGCTRTRRTFHWMSCTIQLCADVWFSRCRLHLRIYQAPGATPDIEQYCRPAPSA